MDKREKLKAMNEEMETWRFEPGMDNRQRKGAVHIRRVKEIINKDGKLNLTFSYISVI